MIQLPAWKIFPTKFIWVYINFISMVCVRILNSSLYDYWQTEAVFNRKGTWKKLLHPLVAWNDPLSLYQSPPTVRGQTQEQDGEQRGSSLGAHGPVRQRWRTTAPAASALELFMGQMFEICHLTQKLQWYIFGHWSKVWGICREIFYHLVCSDSLCSLISKNAPRRSVIGIVVRQDCDFIWHTATETALLSSLGIRERFTVG